jgi:hypothetical protein
VYKVRRGDEKRRALRNNRKRGSSMGRRRERR